MSQAFEAIRRDEESLVMHTYGRYPVALVRGSGARVWDQDGKEYVDLLAGIAVASLGHCNPELVQVLAEQAGRLWHVSNLFYQEPQLRLARALLSTTHHERAFFCNSGAEANEALVKLARRCAAKVKGRPEAREIVTLSGCFHGRTLGTLAATGRKALSDGFEPLPEGFVQVPAGDLEAMRRVVGERTAAVLLEIIQGEGGVIPLDPGYVRAVEALCRERDVLFCCDEVQAGLCRSGSFWAFQSCGVRPDIISCAKAMANGLPMGCILATAEAARGFEPGSHATTFGGTPLVSAVAAKTVEIMLRDRLDERALRLGSALMARARAFMEAHPGLVKEVRGRGLFIGIELADRAAEVWRGLLERGFICNLCHGSTLRLLPPLVVEEADLSAFMDCLEELLGQGA